jgi:hypothetical protein
MSRAGILSDSAVMEHCKMYQPIPMKVSSSILKQDLHTPFGNKKLKYRNMPNRPHNFDTMAKSLARLSGNNGLREILEKEYPKQIQKISSAPATPAPLPQRAVQMNFPRRSVDGSFTPMNTRQLTDAELDTIIANAINGNGGYDSNGNGNGTTSTASTDDGIRAGRTPGYEPTSADRRDTLPPINPISDLSLPTGFPSPPYIPLTPARQIQIPRISSAEAARRASRSGHLSLGGYSTSDPEPSEHSSAYDTGDEDIAAYFAAGQMPDYAIRDGENVYNSPLYNLELARAAVISGLNY